MEKLQEYRLGSISFLGAEKINWSEIIGSLLAGSLILGLMFLYLIIL